MINLVCFLFQVFNYYEVHRLLSLFYITNRSTSNPWQFGCLFSLPLFLLSPCLSFCLLNFSDICTLANSSDQHNHFAPVMWLLAGGIPSITNPHWIQVLPFEICWDGSKPFKTLVPWKKPNMNWTSPFGMFIYMQEFWWPQFYIKYQLMTMALNLCLLFLYIYICIYAYILIIQIRMHSLTVVKKRNIASHIPNAKASRGAAGCRFCCGASPCRLAEGCFFDGFPVKFWRISSEMFEGFPVDQGFPVNLEK